MKFHDKIALARLKCAGFLNRIVLGKCVGAEPENVVSSIEEIAGSDIIKKHHESFRRVTEAEVVRYPIPEDFPPWFRREKAFDSKNVYFLRDVIVSPESGKAWTRQGMIFQESVGSLFRMMVWGGVRHEPLLRAKPIGADEPVVACPDTGYFHWLLEVMPNVLDALKIKPEARILISPKRAKYVTDALNILFGEKAVEERCIVRTGPQVCSHFLMPACEAFSGFVHPRNVKMLRKAFQLKEKDKTSGPGGKFYISRRGVPKRAVGNEKELEEVLGKIGFETVRLEELRFQGQIDLMSGADVIVGMHGAGLANMIWARKPCQVVEVFPYNHYNDCYARLALTCGYDYRMVACQFDAQGSVRIPVQEVRKKAEWYY